MCIVSKGNPPNSSLNSHRDRPCSPAKGQVNSQPQRRLVNEFRKDQALRNLEGQTESLQRSGHVRAWRILGIFYLGLDPGALDPWYGRRLDRGQSGGRLQPAIVWGQDRFEGPPDIHSFGENDKIDTYRLRLGCG